MCTEAKTEPILQVPVECRYCKKLYRIPMTGDQLRRLMAGRELVQRIFPELRPEVRELLTQNQMCSECWDKTFGGLEE